MLWTDDRIRSIQIVCLLVWHAEVADFYLSQCLYALVQDAVKETCRPSLLAPATASGTGHQHLADVLQADVSGAFLALYSHLFSTDTVSMKLHSSHQQDLIDALNATGDGEASVR